MNFLIAEIDATGWALIIAAAFGGLSSMVVTVVNLVLTYMRERDKLLLALQQSKKLEEVAQHVLKVERATNGMKADLVKEVREASFAKGVKSEVDKSEPLLTRDHVSPIPVAIVSVPTPEITALKPK